MVKEGIPRVGAFQSLAAFNADEVQFFVYAKAHQNRCGSYGEDPWNGAAILGENGGRQGSRPHGLFETSS